ncbi:ATP-dependent rRNA helicase spb4 [Coemansia nantahalensis]|uniref:ATP-dependent rRNA helicase spb4 n=1 Tax=Coemansia nantahalensis TaxID=2789366 RepID=A0ACC1K525_9FUNG|nr:ATP-dependent rRNA helicase spb4 [Coemansia nantahalensis]
MAQAVPTFGNPWTALQPRLSQPILDAVASLGFENMTPVQEGTIPAFMQNSDVVVEAATGSGKTLAFVVPVLELLQRSGARLAHSEVGAVIISPTRELAKQIFGVLEEVIRLAGLAHKPYLVVGGSASATGTADELARMKELGPDVLVGTPGRLEDILCGRQKRGKKTKSGTIAKAGGIRGRPSASAQRLEVLVLDEADRLLDMGFEASLTAIFAALPRQRRTGLFSATMSEGLGQLMRAGLRNPVRVQVQVEDRGGSGSGGVVSERRIPATLSVKYLVSPPDRKLAQILRHIQSSGGAQKYIVYFSTCAAVDYFYRLLRRLLCPKAESVPGGKQALRAERQRIGRLFRVDYPVSVHSLHGQMVQKKREATYGAFSALPSGEAGILLCTDVASRGLDIPDVDCIIQWDPPTDPKSFAHRCGRTARAGRSGSALVFLSPGSEETYIDFLALRKIPMAPAQYLWQADDGSVTTEAPAGAVICETSDDSEDEGNDEMADVAMAETAEAATEAAPAKKKRRRHGLAVARYPADARSDELLVAVRDIAASDREIYERGKVAFVSFVQSYLKHEAVYIFRVKELPIIEAARGFGLLHLPSMPELRGRPTARFERYSIDTDTIPYLDGKREERRLARLAAEKEAARQQQQQPDGKKRKERKKKNNTEAWSNAKEEREQARARKIDRIKKRDAVADARERELMARVNDPSLREMLAKDPLLVKQMLNHRDKSLRDMVNIATDRLSRQQPIAHQTLEAIVEDARKERRRQSSDSGGSSSSDSEDDWEAMARKERIREKLAAKTKRKRFSFNPGFSDEEEEEEEG